MSACPSLVSKTILNLFYIPIIKIKLKHILILQQGIASFFISNTTELLLIWNSLEISNKTAIFLLIWSFGYFEPDTQTSWN